MSQYEHLPPPNKSDNFLDAFEVDNVKEVTYLSLSFACLYGIAHLFIDKFVIAKRIPKNKLAKFSRKDRIYLTEKIFSSLNGFLVGYSGYHLVVQKELFKNSFGIFHYYPKILHYVLSSYVGYSIYDMVVMCFTGDEEFVMWLHHIIGALGAYLMMISRRAAYFPTVFTISELTVIPTNWVWYLRSFDFDKSSLHYKIAHSSRSVSFLILRSFLAPVCLWYAYKQLDSDTPSEKLKEIISEVKHIPYIITAGTVFNVMLLGGMNLWWTIVVAKGILMKKRKLKKRE